MSQLCDKKELILIPAPPMQQKEEREATIQFIPDKNQAKREISSGLLPS
jgi:hypothetical protein